MHFVTSRSLEDYVYAIAFLPFNPGILLETENEKRLWSAISRSHQSLSLWLRHLLLGEALQPEAYQLTAVDARPSAEFWAADFRLITAVHRRTTHSEILSFPSPAALWFYCFKVVSDMQLQYQGLTSKPYIVGKREAWDTTVKMCSELRDFSYKCSITPTVENSPLTLVFTEAQAIAKVDSDFRKDYWLPCVRLIRRTLKKAKDNRKVQFHYLLPDGTLFETGKDKKLSNIINTKKLPDLNHRKLPG